MDEFQRKPHFLLIPDTRETFWKTTIFTQIRIEIAQKQPLIPFNNTSHPDSWKSNGHSNTNEKCTGISKDFMTE